MSVTPPTALNEAAIDYPDEVARGRSAGASSAVPRSAAGRR